MRCGTSPQFRALMRRNLLYRKRYFISLLLEIAFPVGFAALLLWIKHLAEDDTTSFPLTTPSRKVPPHFPNNSEVKLILSFNDYVTAILAKRMCYERVNGFGITGLPINGWNWQVPFVKCDSRRCQHHGEDAYKYCVYPILAVAPKKKDDLHGKFTAQKFVSYVTKRYQQLQDVPNIYNRSNFVKIFESDSAIETYVKSNDYGTTLNDPIGLAVLFEGDDPMNYRYTIRVNSTNINAPESLGRPAMPTTPDTGRLFNSYARSDNDACTPLGGTPKQGPLQNSALGNTFTMASCRSSD